MPERIPQAPSGRRAPQPPSCATIGIAVASSEARPAQCSPSDTRLGRAVRPARPAGVLDPRRTRRLRQRLRQRPLPALAPHGRPRPELPGVAGGARDANAAGDDRHERPDTVVPLSPGDRRPGVCDAGFARRRRSARRAGRRHRRVAQRGAAGDRVAGPERAICPAEGSVGAHSAAVDRGAPDIRGAVLQDAECDDLRPAGAAGRALDRRLRPGGRPARGPRRRRLHLHQRQGMELYSETLLPAVAEGAEKAGRTTATSSRR